MTQPQRPKTLIQIIRHLEDVHLTQPQAEFMTCMLGAVLDSLPTFLTAFIACLDDTPPENPGGYDPGDRTRCG